ncbi:MAG: hypothetical protein Q7J84_16920 [Sulfuricaulis sp.]|nr:hypothetical protein [Sulfuricaulis sp.]
MMTMNFFMCSYRRQACPADHTKSSLRGAGYGLGFGGPKVGRLPMELKESCYGVSQLFIVVKSTLDNVNYARFDAIYQTMFLGDATLPETRE